MCLKITWNLRETCIIISYLFQTARYQTAWVFQEVTVPKEYQSLTEAEQLRLHPEIHILTLGAIFRAIKYCQRNREIDRILKQALDIATTQ